MNKEKNSLRGSNDKVVAKLAQIQQNLKVGKDQKNAFANYKYRTCSDILMAVKPFLEGAILTISDQVILVGDRYYVKATATLTYEGESIDVVGFAREDEDKKGMCSAQVTGMASTYSHKYALNGLLAIDDSANDPDHGDNSPTLISQEQISKIEENFRMLKTSEEKIALGVSSVSAKRTDQIKSLFYNEAQTLLNHQKTRINA